MENEKKEQGSGADAPAGKMLPIWCWVGIILLVYGLLITLLGIRFAIHEKPGTVLGHTNPNLWWGGIMLVAGLAFLLSQVGWFRRRRG